MNQKTLTKLEFDKIISRLEEEAGSFRGRQLCRRLKPMTDLEKINTYQEQTAAAYTRIVRKGRISFSDAAPVEESMKRLEIGGALSITELLRICRLLANAPAQSPTDATTHRKIRRTVWTSILTGLSLSPPSQTRSRDASFQKMR